MRFIKEMNSFDRIIFIFDTFSWMFFTLQAIFISEYSAFKIGIIDKEIHTKISISSVLTLKSLRGEHNNLIVVAIPCYTSCFSIDKCNITNQY